MEVQVGYLTRRRSGSVARRNHEVACEALRFGRGPDNEVHLPDPRIPMNQATLHRRDGRLQLEAFGHARVTIDGAEVRAGEVGVGSVIELGPYRVEVVEPPGNVDVAVTIELVHPLGHGADEILQRSTISLAAAGVSPRKMSWALALIVLLLFLVWPVAQYFFAPDPAMAVSDSDRTPVTGDRVWPIAADLAWNTGEISAPHKFIAENCTVCHRLPFVRVRDSECVACHADIEHHVDPATYSFPALTDDLCQSCHKEHGGPEPIIREDEAFCGDCHGRLGDVVEDVPLLDASNFATDHPEFRPMVITDASTDRRKRMALDPDNWPVERSGLKFPHARHLKPEGVKVPKQGRTRVMVCADCHQPEPGGVGMAPIMMERHCAECHLLQFEPKAPHRTVPHGDVAAVLVTLDEFYSHQALAGGYEAEDAPPSVRRRPGSRLTRAERLEALAWAKKRAEDAAEYVFGKSLCGGCHVVNRGVGVGRAAWRVERVLVADRWMPKGLFDHGRHETMQCTVCHQATESEAATDVLLPGIATCRACHAGEKAEDRVPSTCVMCHTFHQPWLGPMRPSPTKTAVRSN